MAIILGGPGGEILTGTPDADQIDGEGGDDTLIGLGGDDVLTGGLGNDTFHVESAGDLVIEAIGGGVDRIAAYVSYSLGAGVEVERLDAVNFTATTAIDLAGNEFAQTLIGNAGTNLLDGGSGNDTLIGGAGDDALVGGPGIDALFGNAGNDVYYVDDALDTVTELAGEGTDRVATSVSYALSNDAEIERLEALQLSDTSDIDLTGNGFANHIVGNAGNNRIEGGAGNDRIEAWDGDDILIGGPGADQMFGGLGNDTYYFDDPSDFVSELSTPLGTSGGIDRVQVAVTPNNKFSTGIEHIEAINLHDTTPLKLIGGGGASTTIVGNDGDNVIDGGGGADFLTGLGGADVFVFRDLRVGNGVPVIRDFTSGTDKVAIDNFEFGTNIPTGTLPESAFVVGQAAQDANDRLIYDPNGGSLYWDSDGTGSSAPLLFGILEGSPSVTYADFLIVGHSEYTL